MAAVVLGRCTRCRAGRMVLGMSRAQWDEQLRSAGWMVDGDLKLCEECVEYESAKLFAVTLGALLLGSANAPATKE